MKVCETIILRVYLPPSCSADLPLRTPSKKHDEESVASSHKRESPVLKKAAPSLQQRSEFIISTCVLSILASVFGRTINSDGRYTLPSSLL